MRAALLIARKDVLVQFRSGTVVVVGFVAPLLLSLVMNLVFGGLDDPEAPVTFDVAVVDLDGGEEADRFLAVVDSVAGTGLLDVTRLDDEDALRRAVDDGDVAAGWVVPESFSERVAAGDEVDLTVVADVDSPTTASVARSIARSYATRVGAVTLAAQVGVETGAVTPAEVGGWVDEMAREPSRVSLVASDAAAERLDMVTGLIAGLALFFIFFTAGTPVVSIIEERGTGSLHRLRAAPISAASILAGKVLAALALGLVCLLALMTASTVIMGAYWGPPVGAMLLAAAAVVAATGIMSVAGVLARTTEQAGNAQAVVAIVLAVAGGAFTPMPQSGTGVMAALATVTPHGWFLDGLEASTHGGVGDALPAVGVLVAMGLVTGAIGLTLAGRVVAR